MRDRAGKAGFLSRGVKMTRTTKSWLLGGAAMMGALCINTAAHAQSEPGASASTDVITVTARRREENLQDAPVSVTAFTCLLYTSPSPRDRTRSRMPSSA